jgi:hypothetical protein
VRAKHFYSIEITPQSPLFRYRAAFWPSRRTSSSCRKREAKELTVSSTDICTRACFGSIVIDLAFAFLREEGWSHRYLALLATFAASPGVQVHRATDNTA